MNSTISLREYLDKKKTFVIPNYQRGYVWGKIKSGNSVDAKDAVTYMMDSLIRGFNDKTTVFIQGVTVTENNDSIVIIDGQQRTTFFYLLLKYLKYKERFQIKYNIRETSSEFLESLTSDNLIEDIKEKADEEFQDVFFFKKSLRIINEKLNSWEESLRKSFLSYILDNVKFLYIVIPSDKATTVFSMMNGNKAIMKPEELIKAELLRLASQDINISNNASIKELNAIEWDNNMLRSRYAREWDKWLQWWNRDVVKSLYKVDTVMGLLVSTYQQTKSSQLSFESFKKNFLSNSQPIEAKKTFDGLRRLQKKFEDAFNSPQVYNRLGAIIRISKKDEFLKWYFSEEKHSLEELDNYYKLAFLGLTHGEILEKNAGIIQDKFEKRYEELNDNFVYINNTEAAFRLLLRLNIDEDNKQEDGNGRKFDFSIWDRKDSRGRSLEHIYPKSKVWHKETENNQETIRNGNNDIIEKPKDDDVTYIERDSCVSDGIKASEHSIGNLVLLYKDENSSFSNSTFEEKKDMFFKIPNGKCDKETKDIFKSRHLLHTIYKFANSSWTGKDIAQNKLATLKEFKTYYGQE